jgi:hypothetical protein
MYHVERDRKATNGSASTPDARVRDADGRRGRHLGHARRVNGVVDQERDEDRHGHDGWDAVPRGARVAPGGVAAARVWIGVEQGVAEELMEGVAVVVGKRRVVPLVRLVVGTHARHGGQQQQEEQVDAQKDGGGVRRTAVCDEVDRDAGEEEGE